MDQYTIIAQVCIFPSQPGTAGPPSNIQAPTISGVLDVGNTLTAGNGSWANSPTSFAYQWKRNGANITAATNSTYDVVVDDVDANITVTVTATNAQGSAAATSAISYIVLYIVSIAPATPQSVTFGTAFGSLSLPSTRNVTLNNGTGQSLSITWSSDGYDGSASGQYDLTGAPTLSGNIQNTFLVQAEAQVTVQPQVFTETFTTSGSWVAPTGAISPITVECWAGGGTGASVGTVNRVPGGGGGAYARGSATIVVANSYPYTIAAQKLAPLPSGSDVNGLDGDDTQWNSNEVKAAGGKGATTTTAGNGGATADSVGSTKFAGGNGSAVAASRSGGGGGGAGDANAGGNAIVNSGTSVSGGTGGSADGGAGGNGSSGSGIAGNNHGGAGGGARNTGVSNTRGGAGAAGKIKITYSSTGSPPPAAGDAYIIHIAGQSNVISPGSSPPTAPYVGPLNTKMWINTATGFQPLEYGINNNQNSGSSPTALGPELSIADVIGAAAPNSTFISKKGQSGTSMYNQWNIANNAVGRSSALQLYTAVNYLQAQGKTIKGIWVVFRQGEADMGMQNPLAGTASPSDRVAVQAAYKDVYYDLINYHVDQLNSHGVNTTVIPFKWIDVLLDNPFTVDHTFVSEINAAKTDCMANYPTDNPSYATKVVPFATVSVSDVGTADGVHINTPGMIIMGNRSAVPMDIPS